jgi:hypothetical protein
MPSKEAMPARPLRSGNRRVFQRLRIRQQTNTQSFGKPLDRGPSEPAIHSVGEINC